MKSDPFVDLVHVPNEAYLRRVWVKGWETITPGQRTWTCYMLSLWGKHNGGNDSPGGCASVIGRLMIHTDWSDTRGDFIVEVVNNLHKAGYNGDELFQKAREIVIPQSSANNVIAIATEADDAVFVERVMARAVRRGTPLRVVAMKRYCERKCTQAIARELVRATGCDVQYARKRIVWCEKLVESVMFYAMKHAMEAELLHMT